MLVYGNGGIWKTDNSGLSFSDFNKGLPAGADYRQIRSVVQTPGGELFAVSIFGLYRYAGGDAGWEPVNLPTLGNEMLTDAVCKNDTLVVAGRSHLYLSAAPYLSFKKLHLREPEGYRGEVSLFRMVWMLHSGELFGAAGRIIVDIVAAIFIVLCLTGLAFWLLPKRIRHERLKGKDAPHILLVTRLCGSLHDGLGRITIIFTLFVAVTGWCLRPPVMILLALSRVPAPPGSVLDSHNPWNDKLRMIRYDESCRDWLISTSEGFYALRGLDDVPVKINQAPPVSVMGLNVFQRDNSGKWLCGSFSGLYVWNRTHDSVTDYYTHEAAGDKSGAPFGQRAIAGYCSDLTPGGFAVEYFDGTDKLAQPAELETLPMSLWNVALEVHSGRLYMGSIATYVFVFFVGFGIVWCLWSGWKIRKRSR